MRPRSLVFDQARLDRESLKSRTNWSMGTSTLLHILAFLLLTAAKPAIHHEQDLVEITMLEEVGAPGEPEPAAPAAAPSSGEAQTGAVVPQPVEDRFRRELKRADVSPSLQSDMTVADRITSRLAAMRETSAPMSAGASVGAAPSLLASPADVKSVGTGASISLSRGKGLGGTGLTLDRAGSAGTSSYGAVGAPAVNALELAEAPREERAARRAAGADLTGPIADRRIVHRVTPVYPEWAKRDGVEGSVTLYFVVRADGSIKENILIQRTAGFGDFDENARVALRDWRFEPLRNGETGEQWGTITLNFRLRGN